MSPAEAGYRLGARTALDGLVLAAASIGSSVDMAAITDARHAAEQEFPIRAVDLMPEFSGPDLGRMMDTLEQAWIDSGFGMTRSDLLRRAGKRG